MQLGWSDSMNKRMDTGFQERHDVSSLLFAGGQDRAWHREIASKAFIEMFTQRMALQEAKQAIGSVVRRWINDLGSAGKE